jgi:thiamine kinase-like enzyme
MLTKINKAQKSKEPATPADKSKSFKDNKIQVFSHNSTSTALTMPHLFIKYVETWNEFDVYKREKHISTILDKFDWYPKLLYSDDKNEFLIFNNVGVALVKENKPKDLEKQFEKILSDMASVNVKHNDIKPGELLVDANKKIYLCDFGWASVNDDLSCGIDIWGGKGKLKPHGTYDDKSALKRLKLI